MFFCKLNEALFDGFADKLYLMPSRFIYKDQYISFLIKI